MTGGPRLILISRNKLWNSYSPNQEKGLTCWNVSYVSSWAFLKQVIKLCVLLHVYYGNVIYHFPVKVSRRQRNFNELNGKIRVYPFLSCASNSKNMERKITRKSVHETWLEIAKQLRLFAFDKFIDELILNLRYAKDLILPLQHLQYSLCSQDVFGWIKA